VREETKIRLGSYLHEKNYQMRNKTIIITLFAILAFNASIIKGQAIKSFSPEPEKFIQEVALVYDDVTNTKIKAEISRTLGVFFIAWDSTYFSEEEKALVIDDANMLIKRRLSTYPYLLRYFYIIGKLKNGADPHANKLWLLSLRDQDAVSSLRQLQEYLDNFYDFLSGNTLSKSASFIWQVRDTNYRFAYDTVARFIYKKTDLACFTTNDTSVISSTSGIYYPTQSKWQGTGGKVNWKRNRMDADTVFAELQNYEINLKFSSFTADSVVFYNREYFREPLYGSFEEKVLSSPPGKGSSYPRFSSFLKNYEIPGLFKEINYRGGFSMEGGKLIGSGERFDNASIQVMHKGKLFMIVHSNAFSIQDGELSCNPASVIMLVDGDSIYHPGLQMKYRDADRLIRLIRPEEGLAQSPFFNTYHHLNMNCNSMTWQMTSDSLTFETMRGVNRTSIVEFTSDNYFTQFDFYRLQGIDEKNPLYVIRNFADKFNTNEMTPEVLADYMNKSVDQVKAMLLKLSIQGFLFYDQVNDKAIIQEKLYHFIEASSGKKDYDVINITSETFNESNATLNLRNYDLHIRGVSQVLVSDSQQVYIYPVQKEITLKKNRDFVFTGRVKAGLFEFFANECSFEYDSFRLNLPTVDSLTFSVKSFEKNDRGQYPLRKVNSAIEDVGGRILIDHPTNKSGIQPFAAFPVFISDRDSYVYYDKDTAYPRDLFRYTIFPYTIDSLDNFLTDNLEFEGYLASAGIFPDIRQPLKVQRDYSLGFITDTPEEGYPVYGSKGRYYREISLSNAGLLGKGELEYLTSRSVSDHLKFYPDSLLGRPVQQYIIGSQLAPVEYPDVLADSVEVAWYPHADTMLIAQLKDPMQLYGKQVSLAGGMLYTPEALTGEGTVRFENAEMASKKYLFEEHSFQSDTVDFAMYEKESGHIAVTADNYRSLVDLQARKIQFQTNAKGSIVAFPYNQFICYMDNIDWYIDKNEMLLANNLGQDVPDFKKLGKKELIDFNTGGSEFVSTNPEMDSLKFFALKARYDLSSYFIFAQDVMVLRVANAAIFPDSGYVRIYEGGKLATLHNTEIIADTLTKKHHIVQADLDIASRGKYSGKGTYLYESPGQPAQRIMLSQISVDSTGRSVAAGRIPPKDNFLLSPQFAFSGNVTFNSASDFLGFDGGFRIFQDCYQSRRDDWIYFKSEVNPLDVRIPLSNPTRTVGGDPVENSIFISDYEEEIYPSVFENRKLADDIIMYKAFGGISYDSLTDSYRIFEGDSTTPDEGSRYFFLDRKNCAINTYGQIDLGLDFGYINILSYGKIDYLIVPDSTMFNMAITLDFMFDESSMSMMADSIGVADLKGIDIAGPQYVSTLRQLIGSEKTAELKKDMDVYGTMRRIPEEMIHTIVLTDVNMYWNSATNSFVSRGPIGVLGIGRNVVNRYVSGYIELVKRRADDVLTIYLELNSSQYYFFDYRADIMQATSSDFRFTDRIEGLKPEKRTQTKPEEEFPYEFTVSTRRKVLEFLRRMEGN
jgi:hypothetical protein